VRADPGFQHRLAAQPLPASHQLHARIEHWRVVVITPHRRFNLGIFTLPGDLQAWFDDHSAD
jgi:hypothetical protein